MSEELNEELSETPTPEAQDKQPAPELTDEQIASALGVEVDYLKEVKGQITDLQGFYKKLNKKSMELSRQQKAPAPKPAEDDDDEVVLDEKSQKTLRKFIEREFAPILQAVEVTQTSAFQREFDDFMRDNGDAIKGMASVFQGIMDDEGFWPDEPDSISTTPDKFRKNLKRALRLAKAETFDPEAEAERIAAERLKSKVGDDEEVVEVKKKRGSVPKARSEADILADPSIPWHEKQKLINAS